MIAGVCVLNNLGQNLGTYINQRANPAFVGILSYMGMGFSFLLDVYVFHFSFSGLEVLGVSLCLLFSFATAIYKQYIYTPPAAKPAQANEEQLIGGIVAIKDGKAEK